MSREFLHIKNKWATSMKVAQEYSCYNEKIFISEIQVSFVFFDCCKIVFSILHAKITFLKGEVIVRYGVFEKDEDLAKFLSRLHLIFLDKRLW